MSSSDIFSIGSSGLRTYQTQLSTISQNISNAGSQNYTRRTTTIQESASSNATSALYVQHSTFGGSQATGIYRSNDPLLDEGVRTSSSSLAFANSKLNWASRIETSLNDTSSGVGTTITDYYAAMEKLAANPSNASLRADALYKLQQAVSSFNTTSDDLNTVLADAKTSADGDVAVLNTALEQLKEINQSILRTTDGSSAKASLLDSRDALVQTISEKLNVSVSYSSMGVATLNYGGQVIVDTTNVSSFEITQNSDGTLDLNLDGAAVASPTNGSLAGTFAGADNARVRLDELDALAVSWANDMNDWHNQGLTDSGSAGGALLSVGTTAASLSVAITSISDLALANSANGANGNLLELGDVRTANGAESTWSSIVTTQGNVVASSTTAQTAAAERSEAALEARDKVSGVNLDQEAADMLRVQQAYQACAKVIQAAKDIVDSILNLN